MSGLAVLMVDEQLRAHLSLALTEHLRWCRRNGHRPPEPPVGLLAALAPLARTGPDRSKLVDADRVVEPELMTYSGACAMLRCSERTLRRMVAQGRIPSVGVGARGRRFPRAAIEELAAGR
jgi:excisionase family DNA binding protein